MKNINHDNDGSYKIIFILFYTILMKNVKHDRLRTTYMLPWMQTARPHLSLEYKITIILLEFTPEARRPLLFCLSVPLSLCLSVGSHVLTSGTKPAKNYESN